MKFGIHIFPTRFTVRIDEVATAVEARGFESLFVPEHTHIPLSRRTPWPGGGGEVPLQYRHLFDPFVTLAVASAVTRRLRIGTGICLVTGRDPIILAKEAATLDCLSNGRFMFGAGAGWNAEEMADHGTDFRVRWRVFQERISAIKEIWTKDEPEFHGEFVRFDRCHCYPKPVQVPHPPILIGGTGPRVRQRVVDLEAGWMPIHGREDIVAGIADLRERAQLAGQPPAPVTVWSVTPDEEVVRGYEKAGVERVVLTVPPVERDEALSVIDRHAGFAESCS